MLNNLESAVDWMPTNKSLSGYYLFTFPFPFFPLLSFFIFYSQKAAITFQRHAVNVPVAKKMLHIIRKAVQVLLVLLVLRIKIMFFLACVNLFLLLAASFRKRSIACLCVDLGAHFPTELAIRFGRLLPANSFLQQTFHHPNGHFRVQSFLDSFMHPFVNNLGKLSMSI
jgi:hypothetical protein